MRISDWSSDVCSSDLDQMLDRQAIQDVVAYVRSLSDPSVAEGGNADAVAAGAEVFAENCAACHGDDGHGSTELGAPRSEERRVGEEGLRTFRSRWRPYH